MSLETGFEEGSNGAAASASTVPAGPKQVRPSSPKATQGRRPHPLQAAAKRLIDLVFSLCGLIVLAPFLVAVAGAVKFTSRGPVLFSQLRWGRNGETIKVYKFRTMYIDRCDHSGVAQTQADDPRVTRLGRVLRRYSIDELPQLFNVLKGDMSLVGPRCHAIGMQAGGMKYEELVPQYHLRHRVRPGLTGLAQVKGFRGPTDDARVARARIVYDIFYTQHYSLRLDLQILFKTIWMEMTGGTGL